MSALLARIAAMEQEVHTINERLHLPSADVGNLELETRPKEASSTAPDDGDADRQDAASEAPRDGDRPRATIDRF